jgi:hypothetical protein
MARQSSFQVSKEHYSVGNQIGGQEEKETIFQSYPAVGFPEKEANRLFLKSSGFRSIFFHSGTQLAHAHW